MARSISAPGHLPEGSIQAQNAQVKIEVAYKNGQMIHREKAANVTTQHVIRFAVGSGKVGQSFLAEVGDHLVQSPVSFYTALQRWDMTPGYEKSAVPAFTQSVTRDCLFCHAGDAASPAEQRFIAASVQPISCERCHGPSEAHRQHPTAVNIVNPAKLATRERDSVCEQCHLKGAAAVLLPGKEWTDFRAGDRLESVAMHYVETAPGDSIIAVSHAEQLSLSRCARASGGKLWCGSCHDPHGRPAADRRAQIRGVCLSCHAVSTLAADHARLEDADCVSCHMPRRPTVDVAHAAVTDHRIRTRPEAMPSPSATGLGIVSWKPDDSAFAARNSALAWFAYAHKTRTQAAANDAYRRLKALPESMKDAPVAAALGYLLMEAGEAKLAVTDFAEAVKLDPKSEEYELDVGVAENATGDMSRATRSLEQAIELDPYDYRPYLASMELYQKMGMGSQSRSVARRYLRLNPESLKIEMAD